MLNETLMQKLMNLRDALHGSMMKLNADLRDPKKKTKLKAETKKKMKEKAEELRRILQNLEEVLDKLR